MPTDPVCKMEISRQDAEVEAQYQDITYYFCSSDCKESFEKNPEKYVGRAKKRATG